MLSKSENKAIAGPATVHDELAAIEARARETNREYRAAAQYAWNLMFSEEPEFKRQRERSDFARVQARADEDVKEKRQIADAAQLAINLFWREHGRTLTGKGNAGPFRRQAEAEKAARLARLKGDLEELGVSTR